MKQRNRRTEEEGGRVEGVGREENVGTEVQY